MRPTGAMHELHKPIDLPNLLGLLHAIEAPDQPTLGASWLEKLK
jgi:hypothetical protein